MATVDLLTSSGITSVATPVKYRSADVVTRAGLASATGRVAWGGSNSPLSKVPWLPKAGTPLTMDGKMLRPEWDRALRWLFEQYIGGIQAPTIAQVTQSVTQTQQTAAQTANYAAQAVAYAAGVAATAEATRQVAQDSGLSGAESIPTVPAPPQTGGID